MAISPTDLMRRALEAATSSHSNDLPIAAVICDSSGSVVAASKNGVIGLSRITAHAEILAIESLDLANLKSNARDLSIAVTLEPCPMCAWAIRSSGIGRLIFGAYNSNYGAAGSVYDLVRDGQYGPQVEVFGGVLGEECQKLLEDAFLGLRDNGSR